ncbi:T9SS type B sorting domain-containing protein [Flavobacterium nitrogenifigens]|uniref:Gliding motility-associated C-terminal domain-containing protein n=1 Tax=Flavobacterium nitrogenifigens TaxID=1617283 RepID=A0A521CVI6_9FLAO|nr:T9SS type B sorting domain-containing protein [Flavobacterium nitrogenifigens]KAF2332185.1 T9SS type B sorting domain-containing protein [Flavobacterium nitrogenifigens]SMO63467.1 gliding motility-associated C-terminal domain-containing protein [Flavobacterium nitrogenifigens]
MRKPTNVRLILLTLFLLQSCLMLAQNHVPFTPRFDTSIRGDMMLIGNSIVNRDNGKTNEYANDAFTGGTDNNNENMQYIDIDNDSDTFSSSSATLKVPDASRACYNIVYAGLYWSGVYTQASLDDKSVKRSELGNIKFKLANETAYNNITGTLIYDYYNNDPKTTNGDQIPYAYYFNVTDLLKASKNPEGEYTVANVNSARGRLNNGGYAAGWSLFVIYEDPNSSAKYITAYDGFSWIKASGTPLTYAVSGFKTIPTGNVKVKLAFAALEGDANTPNDTYSVNGTQVYTTERKKDNFFCSVINDLSGINLQRRPASTNTLGFDAGIINLNNADNKIIANNSTSANLRLTTSGDGYGVYFNAFNVEVIAPQIALTKIVKDTDGKDIGGQNVTLGQELRYEISIQNKGNDDATSLVITDQLPINVIFNQKTDLLPLPAGIIVKKDYDPVTRKIVFEVTDPKLVTKNNPTVSTIAFKVQVVPDCHSLSEACSNSIDNQAFATYKGKENTNFSIDETDPQGSVNSTEGCAVTPKATNFLVGVDGCQYTENVTLCTDSVDLIPAKGYDKYTWYSDAKMTIKIGEGSPFNVTKEGTYYVYNLAQAPCRSISQSFVVTRFKSTSTNPVLPFASEVLTCADTGQPFPNIYLCGGNDKKEIKTSITDASSIVWERFVEGSCTVSTGKNCPNEALASTGNPSELCKWDEVGRGSDYIANAKGRYRLTVTYKGGVCFNRFYFDVYQNPLTPKEKHTDIICSTNGSITIEDVPAGYEYAISKDPNGPIGAYQSSNIFPISTEGSYTVHIRQTNITTFPCDFTVDKILIRKLDVDVQKVITQPLCAGDKGSLEVAANNANPNYTFVIKQGSTTVQSVGPASKNNAKFDLLAGDYVLTVTTDDGCTNVSDVKIIAPDELTATYDVKSLTACSDGEITINAKGGTAPYSYSINGQPYVSENKITVKDPGGSYSIIVTDSNDCSYTIPTFSVKPIAKPTVTINSKNLSCYNAKEGEISITVTPADSGYTVSYSIAGVAGGAYTSLPTTGLPSGDYKVTVKYTINGVDCTDPEKIIKITGPSATLTASAGVAELSGCGPTGNTKQGMVRITNPQGGVPFPAPNLYRYSFDGGKTYITDNFAYIDPSPTPITLYIKDAAGCIFPMSGIILEEKPADPLFSEPVLTYNCKGEGTATVTVNADANPNYSYSYYLGKPDPANPSNYIYTLNTNSPANIFKDIPVGDYKIKVEYNLVSAPTFSNLLKEDFGSGPPTTAPGIATAYCFNDQRTTKPFTCLDPYGVPSQSVEDNQYSVASFFWRGDDPSSNNSGAWFHYKDHTTNPNNLDNTGDPNGRYLLVNVGNAAGKYGILYSKPIVDVIPNQDVIVDFYVGNLLMPTYNSAAPIIRIELIDSKGNVVARDNTGEIAPGLNHPDRKKWVPISIKLNPGANTNLTFVVRSGSEIFDGNDLVIDDIWVRQLPKSCLQDKILNLQVKSGQEFSAEVVGVNGVKCKGDKNGTFSIVAKNFDTVNGFYYTLNGNATNPTWVKSTTSPITFNDKGEGTYNIKVRFANNASSCSFDIPTKITSPAAFVVNASASAATCKGATVTATVAGGTPDYVVTLKDKNSSYIKTFPTTTWKIDDVPAGTYIVSGTDANGCNAAMSKDLVISAPSKPTASIVSNVGLCFDGSNATIRVSVSGGLKPYTYQVSTDGGLTYSNPSATFNGPTFDYIAKGTGTYQFLILDDNKCDAITASQTINKTITAKADVTVPLSCKTGTAANATIDVTIDGGTAPYTYTVTNKGTGVVLVNNGTTAGPTFSYSATTAATYVFAIKDKNGCPITVEKEVLAKVAVTASHSVNPVTCFGKGDGYVDITPQNGVAPFKIQFNGTGAFTAVTTTPVRYSLLPGSVGAGTKYTYIVEDALGCQQQYTFYVTQPAAVTLTASITTPYNCTTNAATITASAGNGNGGFTYVLKNTTTGATIETNTTGIFNNLTIAGTYEVTATDSKSCPITKVVGTINALNPPKGMTLTPTAVKCPSNTTDVTITNVVNASGVAVPTAGLEYRIKLPVPPGTSTYQTSNTFTGLAAGKTYTFEVRDANFCVYEQILDVPSLPVFTVSSTSKNDISCSTSTDGSAIFTVTGLGNNVAYSYKVDALTPVSGTSPAAGSSFEIPVSNLSAGLHTIVVTNTATTCKQSQTVTIAAPSTALVLNPSSLEHVTCDNKGKATINVVGGWGDYEYTVTPTSPSGSAITKTTNVFSNLNAGDYSVSVKDLKGCIVTGTFKINDKVNPTASIDLTNSDFCVTGSGAKIVVSPNSAPNYMYKLDNGTAQNNGTFTGVTPGISHTIRVTDTSTGCYTDLTVPTINAPISAKLNPLVKDLTCDATNPNAIIEVSIKDGYPDYSYRVNTNGGGFSGSNIPVGAGKTTFTYQTTTGAAAATYEFEIFDSKGCRTTVTQNIAARVSPTATTTPTNPTCYNGNNGSIIVNASLGLPPYTYEVSTVSSTGPFTTMTSKTYSNATAGDYWFRVTDSKKCQFVTAKTTVSNPPQLTAKADVSVPLTCGTSNATQAATITVTVLLPGTPYSGTDKYRYSFNGVLPAGTSNTYTTSTSGPVTVDVFDANNCPYRIPVSPVVNTLNPPSNMAFSQANVISCMATQLDTDLTVSYTGGVGPFKVEITSTDAVPAPVVTVATGVTAQSYVFKDLAPGNYSFKVTDANKCTTTGDYKIEKVELPIANGSVISNVICKGASDGKLSFTVSGNVGATYTYELRNSLNALVPIAQSTKTGNVIDYVGLSADTYTFKVTNSTTTCSATKVLEVKEPAQPLVLLAPSITPITCSPNNGKIVINTTGGWGNNRYTLTQPDGTVVGPQANSTFANITQSGTYGISVTDLNGNGCTVTDTFTVSAKVLPSASIDLTASDLCYDSVGKATIVVTPTVVSPTYRYNINEGTYQVSGTFPNLEPGNYIVKVKDMATGCILPLSAIYIESELKFNATLSKSANCLTQNTEIKGTISGGKPNYSYTVTKNGVLDPTVIPVTGTTFTYTDPVDPPQVGNTTYVFTLTDASAAKCSLTSTVVVGPRTDPDFALTPNSTILCNGDATGSITVTIDKTKGAAPYTISVYNTTTSTSYGTQTTGLPAGDYTVRVTDDKGCYLEKTTTIVQPKKIEFDADVKPMTCDSSGSGISYGSITVKNFIGGSSDTAPLGPFTYTLTNNVGEPTQVAPHAISDVRGDYTFNILNFGIYELTVSDKNGCSITKTIPMASKPEDLKIEVKAGTESCTTASLIVTVNTPIIGGAYHFALYPINSGSTPPYKYADNMGSYQDADSTDPTDPKYTQSTFNGLLPGVTYSFIVYDEATDCYFFKQAEAATLTSSTLKTNVTPANVTCQGAKDGNVSFTFTGTQPTTTAVKYDVYNSQSNTLVIPSVGGTVTLPSNSATNVGPLVPGTYYILFTELDNTSTVVCMNTSKTFTISESVVPLTLSVSSPKNDNCGNNQGIVEAFGKGGTVTKVVVDPSDPTKTITVPAPYLYQIFADTGVAGVIDGSDKPVTDAALSASFDPALHTGSTFNKEWGHYLVYVKDANGCIQVEFVEVKLDPTPVITAVVNSACAAEDSFVIDVNMTTFGIAPYTYSLDGLDFMPMPLTSFSIPNLHSGNHTVEVRDFNGCGNKVTLNPIAVPLNITAKFTTEPTCRDTDGTITAVVTGGFAPNNFEYTLKNNTVVTPDVLQNSDPKFIGLAAGNYTVTVRDLNTNCSKSVVVDLLVPTLVDLVPGDITTTPVDCNGTQGTNDNGTLTVNLRAVNDNPDYKFILTPVLPAGPAITQDNNNYFTGLTAGDYTVKVISSRGCEFEVPANVPAPSAVYATATATPFSCVVDPTKTTVVVAAAGGTGTGTFTFSKDGTNYFTSNSIPSDDKYTFELPEIGSVQNPSYWVKDANGCVYKTNGLVTPLDPLPKLISATAKRSLLAGSQIDCQNGRELIQIDVVGGSTPADFKYEVSVDGNGYIVLTNSAGTPFTYNATTAGSKYQFRITDNVTSCQILTNIYEVPLFDLISVTATTASDVKCISDNNGTIQINIAGYSGKYDYQIFDGLTAVVGANGSHDTATSNPFVIPFGLPAGNNYTVHIQETGHPKCPSISNAVIIKEPAAALALNPLVVTPLGCTTLGAVVVNAKDGWGDYTYTLTQPDLTVVTNKDGKFDNLNQVGPAGSYKVSVKDANGCEVTDSFNLSTPVPPTATIDPATDYCYTAADKATIVVIASSTSPFALPTDTYDYSIDGGQTWQINNNTFVNLTPGDYTFTVRDKFGCTGTTTITTIESQLYASTEIKKEIFCVAPVEGTIRVKASGGYAPYSYTVAINGGTPSAPITFVNGTYSDYTVVSPLTNTYDFVVLDAHSCPMPAGSVTMKAPTAVTFTATPTSPYCSGTQGNVDNGSILFTLPTSNDNPPYTYTVQLTAPTTGLVLTQVNNPLFTGLSAGTYAVNVTSDRMCDNPTSVVINPPVAVEAEAKATPFTCTGTNINETIVTVTGKYGAGPNYTYSNNGTNWGTGNTFVVIDNESAQTLTYYVKDANGCVDDVQITVDPFPKLQKATVTQGTKAACNNAGEVINVVINGGASPANFQYEVYQDGVLLSGGPYAVTGNTFSYTAPTVGHFYQFKITDLTTSCSITTDPYEVPVFNTAKVIANASSSVSCNGLSDGKITFNIVDYTGPYTYQVYNNGIAVTGASGSGTTATANPFTIPFGLSVGAKYTVVITETGYPYCDITSADVNITEPPVLDLTTMVVTVKNQNCWTTGAVITADASTIVGGTPGSGFTFAFVPAGTVPTAGQYSSANTITIATTQVAPLFDSYDVYVKDGNGCPKFKTVNISLDPKPAITNVAVASQCYNAAGYRIDVTANGVGTLEYSLDGVQFQGANFFTVTAAGNYTVTVRDANKCTTTASAPVIIYEPLAVLAKVTKVPTCNAADGTITLFASGGKVPTPSYVYTRDNWTNTSTSPVFTGLAPGITYTFKVRDVNTGCVIEINETIDIPTDVTGIVATATPTSCNGYANGSISVTIGASNNNPVYMYSLAGPVNRLPQDSPFFNDLPFGNYVVTVTSGRGCSATAPVTVGQPAIIVVNKPTVTQYICSTGTNNIGNATITVAPGSVTGGSNDYIRYEFLRDGVQVQNDDRNTYTESDYLGGDYIVNVFDSKGCQGSYATVTIDPYIGIADLKIVATEITCKSDEAIQVTAIATTGTLPTLTYTIVGIDGNTYPLTPSVDGLWTNLKVGNYKIVVTNPVTGCSIERFHIVNEPNTFKFVASEIKNLTCYSDEDGAITLTLVDNIPTPKDNAGRFSYVITHESGTVINGATTTTELKLSNLKRGKYTVVATLAGSPFCDVQTEFNIDGPATELEILASKKDITCISTSDDGEIRISAQGGWSGDYLYKLDGPITVDFSAQNIFTGLKAGLYTVSVKDAGGCVDTDQIRLTVPTPIVVTASSDKTLLLCNGDLSATITVTAVTGGQGSNYLYTLNTTSVTPVRSSGPQNTPSFTGLGAGTYTITVTDGFNCVGESAPITITEPSEVKPSLAETRKMTCLTDTQLTLSAVGGTPPYTYSSDNVTYSTVPFTSSVSFDVTPGVYKYYVKDANGCVDFVSNEITINPLEPLLANLDIEHAVVLCRDEPTGVIVSNATGGLGNYEYTLLDGAGNILKGPQPEGRFDKLLAGDYKVVVKSGDCQTLPENVTINQPDEAFSAEFIPTPVKCFGGNDGQIVVNGKGGTGSYKYSISPRNDQYFDSNIFEKLKAGFYTVIATDEHGCYDSEIVEVKQPLAPLSVVETPGMTLPEQCAGELNGGFTIDIAGGTPPYMVSLNDINGTYIPVNGTQHTFANLAGGTYTVFVKDGGNCPQEVEVDVPLPVTLNPTVEVFYDCVNNAQANMVVVTIDPSNTDPTLIKYALDNGTFQPGNIFTDVAAGPHYITVKHENGCEVTTDLFEVDAVAELNAVDATNQSKDINTIVVKASGGVAPYEYSFNGEPFSSSNSYRIYKTGDYVVIVRDKNGCEKTITVHGTFYDFCMPNYFTPNGDGQNDTIGPDCGALAYKELTFDIYDRYGRVVAKYRVNGKWDGRYHGDELPTGDYWYVLKLNDPKDPREFVGHFTLYR